MMNYDQLLTHITNLHSLDGSGENKNLSPTGLTLGIVVDTDDPLQQGRLRIFCPSLNDNPKKIHHLPWSIYVSPFGGSINNSGYTRGHDPGKATTSGAVQYGFWAIPEQGAHVLVGCIDGDVRRRFYMGCVYEHQETHGVLTGRWKWNGGTIDGPLSSTDSPIEPISSNLKKAFVDNTSREWRTRAADYQVNAVREDIGQIPNSNKSSYLDQQNDKLTEAEPDGWVKPIIGAHGYDWSGYKSLGSFMASRVYGFSSPGLHTLMMDDRPFNNRIRIRSNAGNQILFDDTNERIYINTAEGNSYIEMDKSGNIDIYSKRRISAHAEKGFNFTTDDTFRVHAKKGIHLYAGDNKDQENLPGPPEDGEIRFQSEADFHVITKKNYRHLSFLDTLVEIGGKKCESIGDNLFLQVQNEIDILTNTGDINVTSSGNYNEMVKGNANKFASGSMAMSSTGQAQIFSFDSKMDIGSQLTMNIKSMSQDVVTEAVGANSGKTGAVVAKSPQSQHAVTSEGITSATNKSIKQKASEKIQMQNAVPTKQDPPTVPQDIGDCNAGGQLPTEGYSGVDLASRLAYNAGFRGDSLVTAVAIAGAESSYNPSAVGDVGLQNSKWGPSVGMWQNRTLKNPGAYAGSVDEGRDINQISGSANAQNNANLAYRISNGGTNYRAWSTYNGGQYQKYMDEARNSVLKMCNPESPPSNLNLLSGQQLFQLAFPDDGPISLIQNCLLDIAAEAGNAIVFNETGINMKALDDIGIKGAMTSTNMFSGIVSQINATSIAHDLHMFISNATFTLFATLGPVAAGAFYVAEIASIMSQIQSIVENLSVDSLVAKLIEDIGLAIPLDDICSYQMPHFDPNPQLIFFGHNHDILGQTSIGIPASK